MSFSAGEGLQHQSLSFPDVCDDGFSQVYRLVCSDNLDSQSQIVVSTCHRAADDSEWRNSAEHFHVAAGEIKIVTICNACNNIITNRDAFYSDATEHFGGSQGAHRGN